MPTCDGSRYHVGPRGPYRARGETDHYVIKKEYHMIYFKTAHSIMKTWWEICTSGSIRIGRSRKFNLEAVPQLSFAR